MSFRYMLRYVLYAARADEVIKETLAFCRRAQVDEVMWFVYCEGFDHGIIPLEAIEAYLPALQKARDALEAERLVFSLNPWVTLLHGDSRLRPTDLPPSP